MKVILFGASGMVGQGVLRECLLDPGVKRVLSVVRRPTGQQDPKLEELVRQDFLDYSPIEAQLSGYDACFFCLGITSAGMAEAAYRHITYDITLAAARTLSRLNPGMTFVYVSGMGTDSSEKGRLMWARVKGETENALQRLPFRAVYLFRPAMIVPENGIRSKTVLYQFFYSALAPLLPLLRNASPKYITTTSRIGRAMLRVARGGAPHPVLENADIDALGR